MNNIGLSIGKSRNSVGFLRIGQSPRPDAEKVTLARADDVIPSSNAFPSSSVA